MENRAITLKSHMMVVHSKVPIVISTMALMLLFSATLDAFWSFFALLQSSGHFDVGSISKAIQ
jgi:hypothetical protein